MDDKDQPAAQPAPAAKTASVKPKQWVALLDKQGVLKGFDETGTATGIPVEPNCDLQPGKYRWEGETRTFVPDMQAFKGRSIVSPDAISAIALALIAIRDGKPLPDYTLAWLSAWEKSFDAKGLK